MIRIARHGGVYLILNTWEAEASSFLCAGGQPGLPSKLLASQSLTVRLCLKTKQIIIIMSSHKKHLASVLFSEGHTVVARSPLEGGMQLRNRWVPQVRMSHSVLIERRLTSLGNVFRTKAENCFP